MINIKFDNEYIKEVKKKIINYVSHTNANGHRISYNLSLYKKFVVSPNESNNVVLTNPNFEDGVEAKIEVGFSFFEIKDDNVYIIPELEDVLQYKLIYQLLKGCTSKYIYEDDRPVRIEFDPYDEGIRDSIAKCIAEDISGYCVPDNDDKYAFNKKIARMLVAIIGERYSNNSFFRHDDSFGMMIYSLSTKTELLKEINKLMILINRLITTLETDKASAKKDNVIKKCISLYQHRLINLVLCELYIPYINSVGLDNRKAVRDEIFRGFLGNNYTNLKLNSNNKDSYYWASLINNNIPINNKLSEEDIRILKEQINDDDSKNLKEIYVLEKNDKSKNNIKEFFVSEEKNRIVVRNQNKKLITEPLLIEEILSYAYINCTDKNELKKIEAGISSLCEKGGSFKCSMKYDSLNNKMLIAGIKQIARKFGYELSVNGTYKDKVVIFEVK